MPEKKSKWIKAVFFDLDGTLLDTIDDLADSMNEVLHKHGYPVRTVAECKQFVGEGAYEFARSSLPQEARDARSVIDIITEYRIEYEQKWNKKTKPYIGIINLLKELHKFGIVTVVLSNKRDAVAKETVAYFLPDNSFVEVYGACSEFPLKPDPSSALYIATELGIDPSNIMFVGDTKTDMQTAVSAGMVAVGALWGFRSAEELKNNGAKYLVDCPIGILDIL